TFNQFLPTLGVKLAPFEGYNPNLNPTAFNEFAVIGYRMHSMIHGALDLKVDAGRYPAAQLAAFKAMGIEVKVGEEDGAKDAAANNAAANNAAANKADANKADANNADANKADANKADANKADANKAD